MIIELILVVMLALVLSGVFVGSGRRGPGIGAGLLFFFILFALFGWAANLWVRPTGIPFYGFYWTGPVVATVLLALILLALIPRHRPEGVRQEEARREEETPSETRTRHAVEVGFSAFFWVSVVGLTAVIMARAFSG